MDHNADPDEFGDDEAKLLQYKAMKLKAMSTSRFGIKVKDISHNNDTKEKDPKQTEETMKKTKQIIGYRMEQLQKQIIVTNQEHHKLINKPWYSVNKKPVKSYTKQTWQNGYKSLACSTKYLSLKALKKKKPGSLVDLAILKMKLRKAGLPDIDEMDNVK